MNLCFSLVPWLLVFLRAFVLKKKIGFSDFEFSVLSVDQKKIFQKWRYYASNSQRKNDRSDPITT